MAEAVKRTGDYFVLVTRENLRHLPYSADEIYGLCCSEQYCDTKLIFNLAIQEADDHLEFLQKLMKFVLNEDVLQQCSQMSLEDVPAFIEKTLR